MSDIVDTLRAELAYSTQLIPKLEWAVRVAQAKLALALAQSGYVAPPLPLRPAKHGGGRPRKWTDDQIREVMPLGVVAAARKLDMSVAGYAARADRIKATLSAEDLAQCRGMSGTRPPVGLTKERAIELRMTGMTMAEIGKKLGVSKQRISRVLKQ